MVDIIPDLITSVITLVFALGFMLGEAGSDFDRDVKYGAGKAWYDGRSLLVKWFVDKFLNVFHHFQYGLVSIIVGHLYLVNHPTLQLGAFYFGWGLIVSDLRDYRNVLVRLGFTERPAEEGAVK